ncbi:unnamed protein product [Moneuplotes crassus]|uniref:Uncharacterized protein n=1 Tax=Euplotes crassus TaxID=5936 RepID=A0AAD1XLW2_EUPCR|nr:unnamed protein product [Moneuplotes crassus]
MTYSKGSLARPSQSSCCSPSWWSHSSMGIGTGFNVQMLDYFPPSITDGVYVVELFICCAKGVLLCLNRPPSFMPYIGLKSWKVFGGLFWEDIAAIVFTIGRELSIRGNHLGNPASKSQNLCFKEEKLV